MKKTEKKLSYASCPVDQIQGFVYGPFCSRFWMMRKHINSLTDIKSKENLPFYAWQCLSLRLETRNIDLVILDPGEMLMILRFLILSLKTVDGLRNTAKHLVN